MASSVQDTGYEDELFQYPVGESLHCCICTNVFKDPVMCHNEHIFCRACITTHLTYSQTCPICMQLLTDETLRQAPRGVRNMLTELPIRCEFFNRGCRKYVQLEHLKRHVADCGYAPAVCSNIGCRLEMNKQDLFHHETAVCELRRVECHSCNEIRREMDTMKVNFAAIEKRLDRNEKTLSSKVENVNVEVKAVEENVVEKVELVQQQLNKQEESNRRLEADIAQMKESLNEIMKQLERMTQVTQQTSNDVQAEQMKKGIAEAASCRMRTEPTNIVIAGGENEKGVLNSVEMFSLANRTWTPLKRMKERRRGASSIVHNDHIFVSGGCAGGKNYLKSVEQLSLNAVQADKKSIPWENVPVELPGRLSGHRSVAYNGGLLVIGGYDKDKGGYSDSITEISLIPSSCTRKLLASMPQQRGYHGVALFGDKILIVGGTVTGSGASNLRSVVMYDIIKNEWQDLKPLLYPVSYMTTVKLDDGNVMIIGGLDGDDQPLNKVLMYNIKTQQCHELPNMKYKRSGCVGAVVRDTVIVMGGRVEKDNYLRSVEEFRFDRNSWEELRPMHVARYLATALRC